MGKAASRRIGIPQAEKEAAYDRKADFALQDLEELGRGGMGVVYKAEDTKLERTVAIKFLPRDIAANSEERERFRIEAKAAAALNHPNIATIHAIEEVDDEIFIIMEYIERQELRKIVGAYNYTPLPIDEIVNYASQIAAGLQAAHEKDITHRDIKSVFGKGLRQQLLQVCR